MLGVLPEFAGRRALMIGVDLPICESQKAEDAWHPDAVCDSFVLSRNVNKRFQELAGIRGAPVFVGGRSILNYQALAHHHNLRPIAGAGRECIGRLIAAVEEESRAIRSRP